jgi:hypothetical protein
MKSLGELTEELDRYCEMEELPKMCAFELQFEDGVSDEQRTWLGHFCERWEKAQALEKEKWQKIHTAEQMMIKAGYWGEHPEHSIKDWQYEVRNEDTRLGYWQWCESRSVLEAD